ncbi:unnamed protein product [Tilletia controversa]|nr:unnamed protein product [Tilletia controversa]CAD6919645.1 unnamed protein product [Tilletia controversa]CAD6930459.1 unnamed protein product [Tilletia controversa]
MFTESPLAELLCHNQHWVFETSWKDPCLFKEMVAGQAPKVLWLGCSDSRVPESVITEAEPGQIFVARNIGGLFNPEDDSVVSVLEYAVQALGVENVIVVGHTTCGGMITAAKAVMTGDGPPVGAIGRFLAPLMQLAKTLREDEKVAKLEQTAFVRLLTVAAIKQSMRQIAATGIVKDNWAGKTSPLSGRVMSKISIHGWIHDLPTGKLKDLAVSLTPSEATGSKLGNGRSSLARSESATQTVLSS